MEFMFHISARHRRMPRLQLQVLRTFKFAYDYGVKRGQKRDENGSGCVRRIKY